VASSAIANVLVLSEGVRRSREEGPAAASSARRSGVS
jgi:hypothetical protein